MLNRIRQFITGSQPPAREITNKRLIPDQARVVAGFNFRLGSLQRGPSAAEAARSHESALRADLERRGVKNNAAGIPLESPQLDDVYKQLRQWKETGLFQCTGEFSFVLNPEANPQCEWFEVHAHAHSPINIATWACRADRMPAGRNWLQNNFLTEIRKRIIEEAGLTGLEFTWVRDVGRYQAEQWYRALATKPLGRGLDHPFFDSAKITQPDYVKRWASFEEWRFGKYWLNKSEFLPAVSFGIPILDGLAELCGPDGLKVKGFRQMLREFIPPVDFAYVWGYELPILCCNARARDLLLKNHLLSANDFTPIWVWDKPPEGATVLDREGQKCVLPYPMEASRWEPLQEQLRLQQQDFLAHPKSKCATTAVEVLERFRASQKPRSSHATVPPQLASAGDLPRLPKLWDQVLDLSDDYFLLRATDESAKRSATYEVVSRSGLVEFQKMTEESAQHFIPDFPRNLTHFAHDGKGNWLSFDLKTVTPEGDCRMLKWRHDTLCVVQEWPSIVQLLEESLELAEAEESGDDPQ